jgi:hypothetical protein
MEEESIYKDRDLKLSSINLCNLKALSTLSDNGFDFVLQNPRFELSIFRSKRKEVEKSFNLFSIFSQ